MNREDAKNTNRYLAPFIMREGRRIGVMFIGAHVPPQEFESRLRRAYAHEAADRVDECRVRHAWIEELPDSKFRFRRETHPGVVAVTAMEWNASDVDWAAWNHSIHGDGRSPWSVAPEVTEPPSTTYDLPSTGARSAP